MAFTKCVKCGELDLIKKLIGVEVVAVKVIKVHKLWQNATLG